MQDQTVHILIIDYNAARRGDIIALFAGRPIIFHEASGRTEGLGRLWELAAEGITPRAVLTSWLLDEPDARKFFSLIGREVDHTSLSLLQNMLRIDEANPTHRTMLVCYATSQAEAEEAMGELAAEELDERVALASHDAHEGYQALVQLIFSDTHTHAIRAINNDTVRRVSDGSGEFDHSSATSEESQYGSGFRKAVKRLSR